MIDQLTLSLLRHTLNSRSDPKYVPVRVPHVHLSDIPWHVSRGKSNVQPQGNALSVNIVYVIYKH